MTKEQVLKFGQQAKVLLAEPVVQKAFEDNEEAIILAWRQAKSTEERERQFYRICALDELQRALQDASDSAKLAETRR